MVLLGKQQPVMLRICRLLFVSILVLIVGGCQSRSNHIHFVLPIGFRGAVLVYPNQSDGTNLEKKEGRYTCIIPESGILRIKGAEPFYQWHSLSASFANGAAIPIAHEPERLSEHTIAFWPHGSTQEGENAQYLYDFIGTKTENEAFCKATATGKVVPGGVQESRVPGETK
jgi:hypothetical protein